MSDNFSRRDILKSTGIAAASAGMVGTAAAYDYPGSYYSNTSADHTDLRVYIHSDSTTTSESTTSIDEFTYGVIDGVNDFMDWMHDWMPYVGNSGVMTFQDYSSLRHPNTTITSPSDVYNAVEYDFRKGPDRIHIAAISNNSTLLGQSAGKLYEGFAEMYTSFTGEGIYCYANSDHAAFGSASGYDYGYNTAIHEIIHGMTFHYPETSGYKLDHSLGTHEYTKDFIETHPSIMGTGYAHVSNSDDNELPDNDCFGRTWETTRNVPDPDPVLTKCTVDALNKYHYGDSEAGTADPKDYTDISKNENPYQ